jgi:predicted Zn-dependent peptidase
MTIEGKLVKGVDIKVAEAALMLELHKLQTEGITESELQKVKNKAEAAMAFEDMSLMNRASSIAMYENLGDANLINTELSKYQQVTAAEIQELSKIIFNDNNCSTMYYLSNDQALVVEDENEEEEEEL